MEKSLEIAELYVKAGCDAIEWSLPPKDPYVDPPYIAEKLQKARKACGDYEVYLEKLQGFCRRFPDTEIILLLYQETILELSPGRLAAFCRDNGIETILSGNLTDEAAKARLMQEGIKIAASMNYTMHPEEVSRVCSSNGFVYMQALPSQRDLDEGRGRETLKKAIELLREKGVARPVYCGVGIRRPEDVAFIKESGGQGFFLGSALMQYYEEPERLAEVIRCYKAAGETS